MTYAINTGVIGLMLASMTLAQTRSSVQENDTPFARERRAEREESRAAEPVVSGDAWSRMYMVRDPSVAGVRVHFTEIAVPPGSAFFVQNEDGSESYGPFTGAGPNQDSQFLSPIVHGNTVRIVFESDGDIPAVLPYTVERVEGVDAEEVARFDAAPAARPGDDGGVQTSLYGGVPVAHATVGGLAIHEGDILLGETKNLQPVDAETAKGMQRHSFGLQKYPSSLWPGGVIPYVVDSTVVSKSAVSAAVSAWNASFAGNAKLTPRTTQSNYVYFTRNSTPSTCSSYVGTIGGAQPIYVGDYCTTGNLIHEIGHAFGLLHEHTRLDRGTYVTINYANINTSATANFEIPTYATDLGSYDFGSIMHYPSTAFSINGQPTIVTKPAGIPIGQRTALSAGDIAGINKLYPPSTTTRPTNPTATFATNPPGLALYVDGVLVSTPDTLTASAGSVHTIQARSQVSGGTGVRYVFSGWSNGVAATWTLTMPITNATYTANYIKQYQVTASAAAGGTAAVSPVDSDRWYNAGTTVRFTATPASGYLFSAWTGFTAGTPAVTSVTVNASYAPTANFVVSATAARFGASSASFTKAQSYGGVWLYASSPWTAVVSAPWVVLCVPASGTTNTNLPYIVRANTTGLTRRATIMVGSAVFTITQQP